MFAMATLTATTIAAAPIAVTVDVDAAHPTHKINPLYSGCRRTQRLRPSGAAASSQMIFGESFEAPQPNVTEGKASDAWSFALSAGVHGSVGDEHVDGEAPAMHGASSRTITVTSVPAAARGSAPTPTAALINRGLGNEGFYFEAGKEYEGVATSSRAAKTPSRSSSVSRTLSAVSTRAASSPSGRPTSSVARRRTTG